MSKFKVGDWVYYSFILGDSFATGVSPIERITISKQFPVSVRGYNVKEDELYLVDREIGILLYGEEEDEYVD